MDFFHTMQENYMYMESPISQPMFTIESYCHNEELHSSDIQKSVDENKETNNSPEFTIEKADYTIENYANNEVVSYIKSEDEIKKENYSPEFTIERAGDEDILDLSYNVNQNVSQNNHYYENLKEKFMENMSVGYDNLNINQNPYYQLNPVNIQSVYDESGNEYYINCPENYFSNMENLGYFHQATNAIETPVSEDSSQSYADQNTHDYNNQYTNIKSSQTEESDSASSNYFSNMENLGYFHQATNAIETPVSEDSSQSYADQNTHDYNNQYTNIKSSQTEESDSASSSYLTLEETNQYIARKEQYFFDEKPQVCELCQKTFSNTTYLKQHNNYHHTGKNVRCPKCGKKFTTENLMEEHFVKHNRSKPHKCHMCSREYNFKADLTRHMVVHFKGKKTHTCSICRKDFPRKDHMKKHYEGHLRKQTKTNV
ncbi:unnamed protein product [Brassicogethes aeneus]|uniref:C2H2-type domain-containing protein n=1 Tax=Brassicogethes aeneus TaxID=1431903 RepID=A0A9P0F8U1_BRAAE|nr:unnamed protein product [Brassicogethes aeneus]